MSNEMVSLAHRVLGYYDIKPDIITVIQSGGIKTVWKIGAGNADYCLKRQGGKSPGVTKSFWL